jgi:hypothetical protein
MLYRLLTAGAAVCALGLLGFTGEADATSRLMLKTTPGLTILAEDEENAEVQNLLEPETDNGVPGGPSAATPGDEPKAEGEMKAKPEGEETKEMKEEGR